ncbi:LrgB family protein [Cytobacillus oceanisediminis]|uniref:LrgB family protein n=1 Tax=Cytobacillus oceanisediminis TaxID=665099 RepID=UPI0024959CAA|nr:LrgB family protein [Cytobacillus oceanisediminis]
MSSVLFNSIGCILMTLASYIASLQVFRKFKKSWLNPLYTGTALLITILLLCNIPLTVYQKGSSLFELLLQLSVVSFAVPLYKEWPLMKRHLKKIFSGVFAGTSLGIFSVYIMSQVFQFNQEIIASLIPRSVTLPVALTVSDGLGGSTAFTVFFVLFSGLFSVMLGPNLLKWLGINSKAAKGLAMGTSAQMLGASRSLMWGEEEGAMGCIAMTTSAIILSLFIPLLLLLL